MYLLQFKIKFDYRSSTSIHINGTLYQQCPTHPAAAPRQLIPEQDPPTQVAVSHGPCRPVQHQFPDDPEQQRQHHPAGAHFLLHPELPTCPSVTETTPTRTITHRKTILVDWCISENKIKSRAINTLSGNVKNLLCFMIIQKIPPISLL